MWWGQQMGRWPEVLGPFARFFFELESWDKLHANVYDEPLLNTTERPREFGWVLRPSRAEFDQFVHLLDKLLSEILRHQAAESSYPVSFTIFVACQPSFERCHVLRLSQLDNPLR